MTISLTPEEKITIAEQHLRSLLLSEYNNQLSLLEANAATTKNEVNIDSLNASATEISAQKAALQREIDSLNAEITPATPTK
jgi:hypothetical protein